MTTTTKTLTKADHLRAALKAAGYNAKQVTVRYDHTTLRVTIRTDRVSLAHVAEIAGAFEQISRDQATGEILCGGNTFVDVSYDDAVLAPHVAAIVTVLSAAREGFAEQVGHHVAFWSRDGHDVVVHTLTSKLDGRKIRAYGMHHGAEQIAVDLLSRGEIDAAANAVAGMTKDADLVAVEEAPEAPVPADVVVARAEDREVIDWAQWTGGAA